MIKSTLPQEVYELYAFVRPFFQVPHDKIDFRFYNVPRKRFNWNGYWRDWDMKCSVRINTNRSYPDIFTVCNRPRKQDSIYVKKEVRVRFENWQEAFIFVLSHELCHAWERLNLQETSEITCDEMGLAVLKTYRNSKIPLM